ncbi:hypothetical protein [Rhizobium laguerreae]|uniref:hypothetical protein n=1 Tax=Rhizobium laguerreae TaxID=1076926 RepID=UPI001C91C161|nr:hypothetical protein [Rhizobium laguerreae]
MIVDMRKHAAFAGAGHIDASAKQMALAVFDAATALIETRIAAIRQCVDIEDTEVVVDTEALAARAAAWRAEVEETIRIVDDAAAIATRETPVSAAGERHDALVSEWTPYLGRLKDSVTKVERDGGEALAAVRREGFENDPIFAHLLRRNAKGPEKRFSLSDRLVARWSSFGEELAKYRRTVAYAGQRAEWLESARRAISEAEDKIAASRREQSEAGKTARSSRDEAAAVAERGWQTLLDLLAAKAPAFSDLDLDAACGVAREAAAAALRNGTAVVPLAAEQADRLAELDARRDALTRHLDRLAAFSQ